jgi:hypothetical protein
MVRHFVQLLLVKFLIVYLYALRPPLWATVAVKFLVHSFAVDNMHSVVFKLESFFKKILQELHDLKRKNSALQMQQFVGEEKNDLLDYLRSLTPEKVCSFR